MFEAQSAPYSPICPRCLEPVSLEDAKNRRRSRYARRLLLRHPERNNIDHKMPDRLGTCYYAIAGRQYSAKNLDSQPARSVRCNSNLPQSCNHCVSVG